MDDETKDSRLVSLRLHLRPEPPHTRELKILAYHPARLSIEQAHNKNREDTMRDQAHLEEPTMSHRLRPVARLHLHLRSRAVTQPPPSLARVNLVDVDQLHHLAHNVRLALANLLLLNHLI